MKILGIHAREILDSRGNPTVEADLKTSQGVFRAAVPSGASTGTHEALELRDGGRRYLGNGVRKAVGHVNTVIAKALKGRDCTDQEAIDRKLCRLDGTANKSLLGANAILSVSLALARAGAQAKGTPLYQHLASMAGSKKLLLPVPFFNILNGGKHAGNQLSIQEYMIAPTGAASFSEALKIGSEIYHQLKGNLSISHGRQAVNVGDEGGFAPPMTCIEDPLDAIMDAVEELGYFKKIKLGIDAAASTFFRNGKYYLEDAPLSAAQLLEKYEDIIGAYPLISIEDPFHEEAFDDFALLAKKKRVQVVGDDLLVTNPARVKKAIAKKACSALLLKVNQIGTLTEALQAAQLANKHGWKVMVSHRSGETSDDFIADLVVGLANGQIKAGAPCRGERVAKYNQLLRIEEELGKKVRYARL